MSIQVKLFVLATQFVIYFLSDPQYVFAQDIEGRHRFDGSYSGSKLDRVAFPIGGIGAGMFCLEGTGAISNMSVRNHPDVFNEPVLFAAICIKGNPESARVLEGPVPDWKKFGRAGGKGAPGTDWGLVRFKNATFLARFPFAEITLRDNKLPLAVSVLGWSPFIPTDADNSSLPVGALEYNFKNTGSDVQNYVFSYNARNFMAIAGNAGASNPPNRIKATQRGFILSQDGDANNPDKRGDFAIFTDDSSDSISTDLCWFRGAWYDPLTMAWRHIQNGVAQNVASVESSASGASLYISFTLKPGEEKKIHVLMAWYVPETRIRLGEPPTYTTDKAGSDESLLQPYYYRPWYSHKFNSIDSLIGYWHSQYSKLRQNTILFREAFYKSTLPAEILEAVSANLAILKSPTILRQYDGRFWAWEGSDDAVGSCPGSCTHVWNYAQALSHLFPSLERSMRETEFGEDQNEEGHQAFRAALPIRSLAHNFYAAADGQLGGIMKVYREWRISGDSAWLAQIYPKVELSLNYCVRTWDPRHRGALEEPHHNTYDIEFWGPEPMCTSMYLGALEAISIMGGYLHHNVTQYQDLYLKGKRFMEEKLFNGEFFFQKTQWTGLNAKDPIEASKSSYGGGYSPEAVELLQKEGPKYQYGNGCLSDGVIGAWIAQVCGLVPPLDTLKIKDHLLAVYKYNFKNDLSNHSNPQRPAYALGHEGGLLLCSWPKGGQPSLPFVYSNEIWTGIEYEVASHLMFIGKVKQGLEIVRAVRKRYDGQVRNPFDEYEWGHWYARALSSYALLEALTGVRYDAVEKTLYVHSRIGDFTTFLSTATGFGNVTLKNGMASIHTVFGQIPVARTIIVRY